MPTIQSYNKRLKMLQTERSSFVDYWRELSDNHLAHRGRFLTSDRNKGHKRNTKQLNNTSRMAVRTLASGMMSGITSPARPWFRLSIEDHQVAESPPVKEWLREVESKMRSVFESSNLYNALHTLYSELGTFGTGAMGIFLDYENVIWCRPYTVGSYMLGTNGKNQVNTMYREYEMTVAQMVDEFGLENLSPATAQLFRSGTTEKGIAIVHVIEPNDERDHNKPDNTNMPYRSVYYEKGVALREGDHFLRKSGFRNFPIVAPRWDLTGEDVYGTECPGMTALGDAKALQLAERRMGQAIDKVANPPVQAPSSMRNKISGVVAGDIIWMDDTSAGGMRSIYDYRPDLTAIQNKINVTEERVNTAFYVDLFLMMANSDRRMITAREIAEKHEEKLLMLGPVLERLHTELLDPLIDRTYAIMAEAGILPEIPPELEDVELQVEYVSVLAQAQRMVAVGAIERLTQFAGELTGIWPEARHKIDSQQVIDEYGFALGVSPRMIRTDEQVAELAAADAEKQQQAEGMQMGQQVADMAQKAGSIETPSGGNIISDVMKSAGLQSQ